MGVSRSLSEGSYPPALHLGDFSSIPSELSMLTFDRLRRSEIAHGRMAMVAVLFLVLMEFSG